MRFLSFTILLLISGPFSAGPAVICAQENLQFPYEATVLHDGVNVRSGPGKLHYSTDQLSRGMTVAVYRHDPGGWCAIRPIVGSFSLIPADSVEMVTDEAGRMNTDGIKAWVGTRLEQVEEPMWQVKLDEGEEVRIFGTRQWASPGDTLSSWYQIAPPSGEFRWIHQSDIQASSNTFELGEEVSQSVLDGSSGLSSNSNNPSNEFWSSQTSSQTLTGGSNSQTLQSRSNFSSSRNSRPSNTGWRRASQPIRIANNRDVLGLSSPGTANVFPSAADRPERFADSRFADVNQSPAMPILDKVNGQRIPPVRVGAAPAMMVAIGDLSDRLTELELALTKEMLNPPDQWQLVALMQQTQLVYQGSEDANEQAQAERLLNKLRNCQQLQAKMQTSGSRPISTLRSSGARMPVGSGLDRDVQMGNTYDAHGWLDKLVRDSGNAPATFVIKDDTGKITHHVSPVPGLNLHRYLRQKVGVIGQRGYHQQLQLDHVTIERVVMLKKAP